MIISVGIPPVVVTVSNDGETVKDDSDQSLAKAIAGMLDTIVLEKQNSDVFGDVLLALQQRLVEAGATIIEPYDDGSAEGSVF